MRKKIVAGNWKMNGTRADARALATAIAADAPTADKMETIVLPSFVFLSDVAVIVQNSAVMLGAQNLYLGEKGAFTGEVAGTMLTDYDCRYVLVGHSERRQLFHEDLPLVAAKFKAAQQVGLTPILCMGETLEERQGGKTEQIIKQQLASVIEAASIDAFRRAVIAYEPIWAIGTGLTASPEQAQDVHAFIRRLLAEYSAEVAQGVRILYGGSVKADNARGLFAMADIDGGLVGGASLEAQGFLAICAAAV